MAYAALVSLEKTTGLILNHHKCSISVDEQEQITSIREYVIFLRPFLENLPEKANRLEGKIRDLANEAEDLIEYFMLNQIQLDWSDELARVEFERRLKKVREEIGSITGDMMDDRHCNLPAAISSSYVAATGKNDVVIALDEDLIAIKDRLCGESSKLEVIPIVGMGGIGKTTLAQYAYNDPLIVERFHIRVFVQVSQDYSAKEFLSNLLASINLFKENGPEIAENVSNESGIAEMCVYKSLKGRRYLIVMDDIWSTNAWDDVRNLFPDDKNGSRIMLTTRLSDVATYASYNSPLHEMKFMDENQSWNLLKKKVFTDGGDCPQELEGMGKEIAQGCSGLPLAVVLVAGILSTINRTQASWEKIAKNVNSVVDGQLDKILSLSYRLLPHHLRPCFLFMAAYPEDHKIHISRLVKLWVAEGFLKGQGGYKSLEEEAEEYLKDLVKRSLLLVSSWKSDGKIKSCSLHDLVRDMCINKAQEEKFLVTDRYVLSNGRKDERRISIGHSHLGLIQSPTIHTILCFTTFGDKFLLAFLVSFKLLRVLEVLHYYRYEDQVFLPPQLFKLFHLRYLAVGRVTKIPTAISKLENLETLIVRPRRKLTTYASLASLLPVEIWRMPQLRHLVFTQSHMLPDPVSLTLPLENLQTLSGIASCVCRESILKMVPNLKKLGIYFFGFEGHGELHTLVNLNQLEKLKISAYHLSPWKGQKYPVFPGTLKKLSLVGVRLPWKDMSIVGSLPNLQVLKLKNNACYGDIWETADGGFPLLNFLLIEKSFLRNWITESLHFPRLKSLVLYECEYLREIPDCIGEIPTLEVIEVDAVNESLLNSAKQIQEDQQNYGNDALQVRCIHDRIRRLKMEVYPIHGSGRLSRRWAHRG